MTRVNFLNLFWFFSLIILMGHSPPQTNQLKGDTWAEVQQKKTGTITVAYINAPGLTFRNTQGHLDGVCFDIVKSFIDYVKNTKGIVLKAQVMPESLFSQFMEGIRTGQGGVFGLGNITITNERKLSYGFTPPFINNLSFIITHQTVPTLTNLSSIGTQFKGMTAYTVKGTTNEKIILEIKQKYMPTLSIVYLPSSGAALSKVAGDNRSFTSLDFNYYAEALKYNAPVKRHSAGDRKEEDFGIIMPKSTDWTPIWNEFFASNRFVKSPEYRKILLKHLGPSAVRALEQYR